ncbi:hypothetical protein JCM30760_26440 [Thiomicrorhabdus hydrogeniphila]
MKHLKNTLLVIPVFLFAMSAEAGQTIVVKYQAISCPDSMKTMRFTRTNVIRPGYNCVIIPAGTEVEYIGEKELVLSEDTLSKITLDTVEYGIYEGYVDNRFLSEKE